MHETTTGHLLVRRSVARRGGGRDLDRVRLADLCENVGEAGDGDASVALGLESTVERLQEEANGVERVVGRERVGVRGLLEGGTVRVVGRRRREREVAVEPQPRAFAALLRGPGEVCT